MLYEIRMMREYGQTVFSGGFGMKSAILRKDSHMHVSGRMKQNGGCLFHLQTRKARLIGELKIIN